MNGQKAFDDQPGAGPGGGQHCLGHVQIFGREVFAEISYIAVTAIRATVSRLFLAKSVSKHSILATVQGTPAN